MRKLVSVQNVAEISAIQGADRIMEAKILGWRTIVKKDEFSPGDFCLFFEVDAVLPEAAWSEFMRSRKFRVKTMKMKGVLSQGLALPLRIFSAEQQEKIKLESGFDCTEILGVTKYELPIVDQIGGFVEQEGPFPSHVPRTDEDRIQSNPALLDAIQGRPYAITVKIDGSSMTATFDREGHFLVCSRNFILKRVDERLSKHWIVAEKYQLAEKLKDTGFAVQGELVGPGIQNNYLRLHEPDLLIFNVYDWQNRRHLNHYEMIKFCEENALATVPTQEVGERFSYELPTLLETARGLYHGTQNDREGLVVRSIDTPRISFKALNNDFLLKED